MEAVDIRLSAHGEELLKEQLARGGFRSPEEVIERALEALANREERSSDRQINRKTTDEAVADILELRKGVTLGGIKIKDLIHEGHRF
jgi:Arc/MetJ-type ribon-helix-helix transcriptional regulator